MPVGDINASAAAIRAALVNIICYSPEGSGVPSISATGVIIDSRGIILTNAHVAQLFLLADRGIECGIRTGSPATLAYNAALVFISPAWIHTNPSTLAEPLPMDTGESDFALLAITKSATNTPLPSSFPAVPLAEDQPVLGEPVVVGSYGAQYLQASAIVDALYPTIVFDTIQDGYTFSAGTIDLVSLGSTAASQEGSSGGGAVDASGKLTATITTVSSSQGDTSTHDLSAITASYIRHDYAVETGYALDTLLAEKVADMIANFAPQMPALEAQLITTSVSH